jgi:hypothetical protein
LKVIGIDALMLLKSWTLVAELTARSCGQLEELT